MRESPKAQQAWTDYLQMGPGRSLHKLLDTYQTCPEHAPTRRLTTLKLWSRTFAWQARLAEIADAERQALVARGIAERQNRFEDLNDVRNRLHALIDARAADLAGEVPGGATGLLVRRVRQRKVSGGDAAVNTSDTPTSPEPPIEVVEYVVDAALLRELRAIEKQAAQELGQWGEHLYDQILKRVDLASLTTHQLERLADGDDPAAVIGR